MRGRKEHDEMHGHRPLLAGALLVSILLANTPSAASATAVVVGEVTSGGAGLDGVTLGLFRKLVEREIGRLELDQGLRREGFVFSASLVRLDAHATHGGAHASCVVAGRLR